MPYILLLITQILSSWNIVIPSWNCFQNYSKISKCLDKKQPLIFLHWSFANPYASTPIAAKQEELFHHRRYFFSLMLNSLSQKRTCVLKQVFHVFCFLILQQKNKTTSSNPVWLRTANKVERPKRERKRCIHISVHILSPSHATFFGLLKKRPTQLWFNLSALVLRWLSHRFIWQPLSPLLKRIHHDDVPLQPWHSVSTPPRSLSLVLVTLYPLSWSYIPSIDWRCSRETEEWAQNKARKREGRGGGVCVRRRKHWQTRWRRSLLHDRSLSLNVVEATATVCFAMNNQGDDKWSGRWSNLWPLDLFPFSSPVSALSLSWAATQLTRLISPSLSLSPILSSLHENPFSHYPDFSQELHQGAFFSRSPLFVYIDSDALMDVWRLNNCFFFFFECSVFICGLRCCCESHCMPIGDRGVGALLALVILCPAPTNLQHEEGSFEDERRFGQVCHRQNLINLPSNTSCHMKITLLVYKKSNAGHSRRYELDKFHGRRQLHSVNLHRKAYTGKLSSFIFTIK